MDTSRGKRIRFTKKQLCHAFKHAADFGILGQRDSASLHAFQMALLRHVASPHTVVCVGSFRNLPVVHLVDRSSGLNVIRKPNGDFLSAWKLTELQLWHVLNTGRLGGG